MHQPESYYLRVGGAGELADEQDRRFYRFLEILPGSLAWLTIFLMFFLSWLIPAFVAVFIILFDVYWLLKTVFLSFHLRGTFRKMRLNLKTDWMAKLGEVEKNGKPWRGVYHLVLLPMYNESYDVVRETLDSLTRSRYPLDRLIVALATEERAMEADAAVAEAAKKIEEEFKDKFFRFLTTRHPADIAGELAGKGSNDAWAVKEAKRLVIDPLGLDYEKIIVSVFDVDTQIFPDYFGCLTFNFLTCEHPLRSSFQPIPFFTNNIYWAPALARIISFSATFWQMMQQSRPERLTTFSSHAMAFAPLAEIGFWQTNVVSEDSRIFWQCFLHFDGDWRTVPLFYPVSMDANVAPSFWKTMVNQYKQQRRWGYGVENIPYMLFGFSKNKKIPFRKKLYFGFNGLEGFHSWATNALIVFSLGWLPLILGGDAFKTTMLSYNLPQITRFILLLATAGIASSAVLSVLLLPPKPEWFRWWHYALYILQWVLTPFSLIAFGALPGLEAQTRMMLGKYMGFWVTPKSRN